MGGNTSKQQALAHGISNHHVQIHPIVPVPQLKKMVPHPLESCSKSQDVKREIPRQTTRELDVPVPANKMHQETQKSQKWPATPRSSYDFNFSPKPMKLEDITKESFYHGPSSSKLLVHKPPFIPQENMVKEKSRVRYETAVVDFNDNYVINNKVNNVETRPRPVPISSTYSKEGNISTPGITHSEIDPKKKKLIIRGLKRFCESRGSSCPPTWVKEFPCKSKFHPDNYVYDWDEGPNAVKRNTTLMSKCSKQGGRCGTCGIYAVDVCRSCRKCDLDCRCPKIPKIPEFVSQLLGSGATWPQPDKIPRDFAEEEQSRQNGGAPANYNPYYSQMPMPSPCYSPYPYYSPIQYNVPAMYPGCYPAPPTYMPYPMMPAQPPVSNYYNPGAPNYQTNQTSDQSANPQTSLNMSFYE